MARYRVTKQRMRDGSIRFRLRGTREGEEHSLGLYDDESVAHDDGAAWIAKYEESPDGLTLGAWGQQWLELRETSGGHRNAQGDRSRWSRYVAGHKIAGMLLREVKRAHVMAWIDDVERMTPVRAKTLGRGGTRRTEYVERKGERLSAQTVKHAFVLLSVCFANARTREKISSNPFDGIDPPEIIDKPTEKWTWLREHEIAKIEALAVSAKLVKHGSGNEREMLTPKQRAAFLVAIYTGLREGEVWGLRWCDVQLAGRPELHVRRSYDGPTKTTEERHVPLLPQALDALTRWRELAPGIGEALVFTSSDGEGHCKGYDAGWEQVADRLSIDARFHDLRHTCASHLVQGTWTPTPLALIEVRDWLGHESIVTTERYAHLVPGGLHAAIARKPATVTKIETRRKKR